MSRILEQRLQRLIDSAGKDLLKGGSKGVEKESLRVTLDGRIAQTPHPAALGSSLTNPHITTDYSEALLEFVTPPFADITETLDFLFRIHQFVYRQLDNEMLWATSMPCLLEGESSIPIAYYGTSNVGKMKHVYRRGLEYRYGRTMQAIAGVHFNYSLPLDFWPVFQEIERDSGSLQHFISDAYFGLIRNFQRQGWIVSYLFGASPAVCKSFFKQQPKGYDIFAGGTYFQPYATSLRMSDIGYKNKAQANLRISYNNLDEYVRSLTRAIETPDPEYTKIGVIVDGEYRQLNANVLQIENEYYSFVRPKRSTRSGEKPTLALKHKGVEYIEIRALDVDPFHPLGVNEDQLRFMEAFLIYCLLLESPTMGSDEQKEFELNQQRVACCGRDSSISLRRQGADESIRHWGEQICTAMQPVVELLDAGEPERPYARTLERQRTVIENVRMSPSALALDEIAKQDSFFNYALSTSRRHQKYFNSEGIPDHVMAYFENQARESLRRQKEIEGADEITFEEYLRRYFTQT